MGLDVLLTFVVVLGAMTAAYPQSTFHNLTGLQSFHPPTPTPLELEMQQRQAACNCEAIGYIIITFMEKEDGTPEEEPEYSETTTFASTVEEATETNVPTEISPEVAYNNAIVNEKTKEIRRKREDQDWQLKNTNNKIPCCGHRYGRDLTSTKVDSETDEVDSLEMHKVKREAAEPDHLNKGKSIPCCGNRKRREAEDLLRNAKATNAEKIDALFIILEDLEGFCKGRITSVNDNYLRNKGDIAETDELLKIRKSLCGQFRNTRALQDTEEMKKSCCGHLIDNRPKREIAEVSTSDELKSLCCRQLKELEGMINIRVPRECKQEMDNCCGQLDEADCCRSLIKREAAPCCGNRKRRGLDIGTQDEEDSSKDSEDEEDSSKDSEDEEDSSKDSEDEEDSSKDSEDEEDSSKDSEDEEDSSKDSEDDSTEDSEDKDYAGGNDDEPKRHPCKPFFNFGSIGLPFYPIAFICIEDYEKLGICRDGADVNCCNLSGELRKKCFQEEFLDMFSASILTLNEEMGRQEGARAAGLHVPTMIPIYPAKSE